jgi:hypothetical protein
MGEILSFFMGAILAAAVVLSLSKEHSEQYRSLLVECGKAHYDTTTGEFVQHGKESK